MTQTAAHIRAVNRYNKNKYDRININIPKGSRTELKAIAAAQSESLNTFIIKAIEERIERLKGDKDE
jgi:predicted HicB family RNase H-like nuclease